MSGPDRQINWRNALKLEFLEHLPVWYIYLSSMGMLYVVLANYPSRLFDESGLRRGLFAIPAVLPLSVFALYTGMRIHRSTRLRRKRVAWSLLGLLTLAVPAAIVLFHRPFPLEPDLMILLFEVGTFVWFAAFVGQALLKRGRWSLLMFFGVTFLYGMILENTGIIMRFFFETGYHFYLGQLPAPLCTMMGWPIVFYVMFSLTERFASWWQWLRPRAWARAVTVTALALCFDAQMDPLASLSGIFWRWNQTLVPVYLGVPVLNFVAWVGAVLPFGWMLFRLLDREGLSPAQKNYQLLLRLWLASLYGGLLCFAIMAMIEGGFHGATYRILGDFFLRLLPY